MKEDVTYQHLYTYQIYRIHNGRVEEYDGFSRPHWNMVNISVRLFKKLFKLGFFKEVDF